MGRCQLLLCLPLYSCPVSSIINGSVRLWRHKGNLREWKFLGCQLRNLFNFRNTRAQEVDLKLPTWPLCTFHFLPLKVSTGRSPALVWVLGSVILETFSIHPAIKTLQLRAAFLKRKSESIRSSEDGLACRLHNIKKNHVGKWRSLFEELWRKATNELYTGFPPVPEGLTQFVGKEKNPLWY